MVMVVTDVRYEDERIQVSSVSDGLKAIMELTREVSAPGRPTFCRPHGGDRNAYDILTSDDNVNTCRLGLATIIDS